MRTFNDYCREFIKDNIRNYENTMVYSCDLGFTITKGINCNGTATYSTHDAIEYIKEWWYDAADYSDYENLNFGERSNPFSNPEAFMVRMIIEGVNSILSQCSYIDEHWNENIELTDEVIDEILSEIDDYEVRF